MNGFSRATSHGPEHEAHFQAQRAARVRFLEERVASSPRATVAFSALSAVIWLRKKVSGLAKRLAYRDPLPLGKDPLDRSGDITR